MFKPIFLNAKSNIEGLISEAMFIGAVQKFLLHSGFLVKACVIIDVYLALLLFERNLNLKCRCMMNAYIIKVLNNKNRGWLGYLSDLRLLLSVL